jgi:hypothetical protein
MRKKLDENATDKTIKKEKKSSTSEPSWGKIRLSSDFDPLLAHIF